MPTSCTHYPKGNPMIVYLLLALFVILAALGVRSFVRKARAV